MAELKKWYNHFDNIYFEYYNDWSDPSLHYKDYIFNYWDVEDYFLSYFNELIEDGELPKNTTFAGWMESLDNKLVEDYLDEVIESGYFKLGSKDWRDNLR